MHKRSCGLKRIAPARLALACALSLGWLVPAGAGHLGPQEAQQAPPSGLLNDPAGILLPAEPANISIEELAAWEKAGSALAAQPNPAQRTDSLAPAGQQPALRPGAAPALSGSNTEADPGPSMQSAVKESVRPVYEQLVESGAVETLHEVKANLGLDRNTQWGEPEKSGDPVKPPGQWGASDAGRMADAELPKTEAQARVDLEMATMMREKLIDQITPWLLGLVGLFILGYLVKLLVAYVRWKTGKRNQRRIARAQRQTSRHIRRATQTTSSTTSTKAGSKETV